MEFNPNSHDANERRINFLYRNNGTDTYLRFPTIGTTGQTVAYQSWVDARIQSIINASPNNLDTLKELADALGNDPNFSRTVLNKVGQADTKATNAQTVANKAQTTANSANNNANGRVSKSGDTMTGDLIVPYLKTTGGYISVSASNSSYAGIDIIRTGSSGAWRSRVEALPDKRWKFWTENSYEMYVPAANGTLVFEEKNNTANLNTLRGSQFFKCDGRSSNIPQGWSGNVDYNGIHADSDVQRFQLLVAENDQIAIRTNDSFNDPNAWSPWNTLLTKSNVAILTGVIAHGGTIPLPAGFSESQCKWMVSIANSNPSNSEWDIEENKTHLHFRLECWTNGRTVHARQFRHDTGKNNYHNMTVSYLIIGVK